MRVNPRLIKVLDIKAERGFLYSVDPENYLVKINKKKRTEREKIALIDNLKREEKYIIFVSSNLEGYLTIERAIRIKKGMNIYKTLNFPKIEEGSVEDFSFF